MQEYPNLLLIGGCNRNVGKTTLILNLIKRYKDQYPIIGLKVTSIYPDDNLFHGAHESLEFDFEVFEELNKNEVKDTSKMLLAGAQKVFYIRSKDEFIPTAFDSLINKIPTDAMIICESISLRTYIKPGLFLLIQDENSIKIKQSFIALKPLADFLIITNQLQFDFDIDQIIFEKQKWMIEKKT